MRPAPPHLAMVGVFLALFLASVNQTMVSTALPSIVADLGGMALYSWVFTAYMLTSTVSVPILGKLSDLYGRRGLFLAGIATFVASSLAAGFAHGMPELIALRACQGLGAGAIFPLAFAIVGDLYPPHERGRIQGLIGAAFGASSLIGPLAGGWLTESFGWAWSFWFSVPVGLLAFVAVALTLPASRPVPGPIRLDWLGALLLVTALTPLLLLASLGGSQLPWNSPLSVALAIGGLAATMAFWKTEQRAAEPIIPPALFANPVMRSIAGASVMSGIVLFGDTMFLPLLAQGLLALQPTHAGLLLTPFMLGMVGGSSTSGHWASRWHRHRPLALGGLLLATGAALGLLACTWQASGAAAIATAVFALGLGLGATFPVFLLAAQSAVPPSQLGSATALVQFFRSIGGTFGVAVLGALLVHQFDAGLAAQGAALGVGGRPDARAILTPAGLAGLPPDALAAIQASLRTALAMVFAAGVLVAGLGAWIALRMPETARRPDRI
ncbi:MAG: MFS transporter [Candidatus Sericytochromatia bacterium]|nr:MFS transporter [Candidatus Sericytochromatia bacterium]